MVTVFVDIETTALEFKEKEINDYLMEKKFTRSLHPLFSKIITTGLKKEAEDPKIFHGDNEKELLVEFWKYLSEQKIDKIVTWNGYGFDMPFINLRSIINGLRKTKIVNLNKWKMLESNHIDLMQYLSSTGEFTFIALEIACRLLGIPVAKDRIKGDDIEKLYRKGDFGPIVEKNKQDLVMLEGIYKKIQPFMT